MSPVSQATHLSTASPCCAYVQMPCFLASQPPGHISVRAKFSRKHLIMVLSFNLFFLKKENIDGLKKIKIWEQQVQTMVYRMDK